MSAAGVGMTRKRMRKTVVRPDLRPTGSAAPANFEKLIEEEGYAVVPGLVEKKTVMAAVRAIESRVHEALAGFGVDNPWSMGS